MNKFEEYVKSLSPRGIVMLMIESLENPTTRIDMDSFGRVEQHGNRRACYGCAATNTALRAIELSGAGRAAKLKFSLPTAVADSSIDALAAASDISQPFLKAFEYAINELRAGDIREYNTQARKIRIAELKPWPTSLPHLDTNNYKHNLKWYRDYAMEQSDAR